MYTSVIFLKYGPVCVHNASSPFDVNAVLVGFFFGFSVFFPYHFVFDRMQMSLIKFLL